MLLTIICHENRFRDPMSLSSCSGTANSKKRRHLQRQWQTEKESSLHCFLEAISQSNIFSLHQKNNYSWVFAVYTIMKPNIFWGTVDVNDILLSALVGIPLVGIHYFSSFLPIHFNFYGIKMFQPVTDF